MPFLPTKPRRGGCVRLSWNGSAARLPDMLLSSVAKRRSDYGMEFQHFYWFVVRFWNHDHCLRNYRVATGRMCYVDGPNRQTQKHCCRLPALRCLLAVPAYNFGPFHVQIDHMRMAVHAVTSNDLEQSRYFLHKP